MKRDYESLADLPQSLKDELSDLAQRAYLSTHRRVWEKCRMGGMENEDDLARAAHDAAMLAVEAEFEKDERGRWQRAPVASRIDPDKLTTPDET
ncbi:MAG TPA: ChaB family protein [Woeseiaceae bacterium]|jgi:cation transport regulator ChaB|nr:ChaB family protein [Woeseiaceae bacterium]